MHTDKLSVNHLLDIASLNVEDINILLRRAAQHKRALKDNTVDRATLAGKIILTLFTEHSTRTRNSFEMAALRLGAALVNWDERTSSAQKGEIFSDTLKYLSAFRPDAIVMRHHEYNAPHYVAGIVKCPVLNAGDSWRAHPTQALVDALTLIELKGRIEGLHMAICGDVAHSRVAACNMSLFHKLGGTIHLITPSYLRPAKLPYPNIKVFDSFEEGLPGCDAVMMLRIQKERMDQSLIPDDAAYFNSYGLTPERLALAKPDAIVLHPGPMNRGIEISDEVADDPHRSAIFRQADNRVPVNMAALDLLLG
jgi:aspartate carbamoyltransferase catalytic subunit